MKLTYTEQLQHPNWQKRRLDILSRDGWACRCCGAKESTLHVHHKFYFKGRMAWEYEDDMLVTLCEACHDYQHTHAEEWKQLLAKLELDGPGSSSEAMGLLAGWLTIDSRHRHDPLLHKCGAHSAVLKAAGAFAGMLSLWSREDAERFHMALDLFSRVLVHEAPEHVMTTMLKSLKEADAEPHSS